MFGKRKTKSQDQSNIAHDVMIKGDLVSKGDIFFSGLIDGDIRADGLVVLLEGSQITGNVHSKERIVVGGTVTGDLISGGAVDVMSTGKVLGNIRAKKLQLEFGSVFNGNCAMDVSEESSVEQGDELVGEPSVS